MAETQYTHSTTGACQFVGDAGLAVVAEINIANRRSSDPAFIVWFTLTDGTGTLTAATYADAYAIGLALATYGMAAGERVKLEIQRGLAPTLVGLTAAASTVRS